MSLVCFGDYAVEFLSRSRVFQTSDLDEGEQFSSRIWERHRTQVQKGRYGIRWNQIDLAQTSFSYVEYDACAKMRGEGPMSDTFRLVLPQTGSIRNPCGGVVAEAGSVVVASLGSDLRLEMQPSNTLLVNFKGALVRSALAHRFRELPPLRGWFKAPSSTEATNTLNSMASWLATELNRPRSLLASPGKPRLHSERLLLSLFVECLAQSFPDGLETVPDISKRHVRWAEEWIDGHLIDVLEVQTLATKLGVSVRSLQMSFQRVRGYSPREAIMRRRLEFARQALLDAEEKVTVTAIATEFGFYDLGWFAKRYRQQFGESPSQTFARRIGPKKKR
jgi:AraC-like DNA-binding protein